MRVLGSSLYLGDPELGDLLNTIGHYSFASGTIAMTLFTLFVFRREKPAARLFAALTSAAIVATTAHTLLGGYASIENSYSMVATNFSRLIPTSWAFYESLHDYRTMRHRQDLGLAEPLVVNRFLLWSIWTFAVTLLPLIALMLRTAGILSFGNSQYAAGINRAVIPPMLLTVRVLFVVIAPIAAAALSLTFFPPAAYTRQIRARGARPEPS